MRFGVWLGVLLWAGCDDVGAPRTEPPAPPRIETPAEPEVEPPAPSPIRALMDRHFEAATDARDAIARGDLSAARAAGRHLADVRNGAELPESWRPHFADMQRAASTLAEASDLARAGGAFGEMSRSCGACHRSLLVEISLVDDPPPQGDDPRTIMRRHLWATDRMWEGIFAPSEARFSAGAAALAATPLDARSITPTGETSPTVAAIADRVHALGRAASTADEPQRPQLYGELLTTCAACHREVGAGGPLAPVAL